MKVSYNWLQHCIPFKLPPIDELVTRIGAQLGEIEEVVALNDRYKDVVIVHIARCERLENSDHLNVCLIDDGGVVPNVDRDKHGLIQVVTGAPNVQQDMFVAWLPPGSTVPSSFEKDPFVLESRELRGAMSHGMLASAKELMISESHDGILELEPHIMVEQQDEMHRVMVEGNYDDAQQRNLKAGDSFAQIYELDDYIITIENKMFTHRPDCFGILGIAREVAGILGQTYETPDWYLVNPEKPSSATEPALVVRNELPELVPRFMAQVIDKISITASSVMVQSYLSRLGIRPINNIVDMTNYYMVLTGQPLHAYDYDKVMALDTDADHASLVIRHPKAEEQLTLLNGKTVKLHANAIVIASESKAIGLAGVMGGKETEVDADTARIILECATFDMYSVRRTSMVHGIFSDAVTRYTKGQSPLQNPRILAAISGRLEFLWKAHPGQIIDDCHVAEVSLSRDSLYPAVQINTALLNERLGSTFSPEQSAGLLTNVEFEALIENDTLQLRAPFWRTDIEIAEDIVEEVGRLHGFDNLPISLPWRTITPARSNPMLTFKQQLRHILAQAGANEVFNHSFVPAKLLESAGQPKDEAYKITNALSPGLQYYRFHALPSMLTKVHPNIKAGFRSFALFEMSKGHSTLFPCDKDGVPSGVDYLDFVFASNQNLGGAAYYQARYYLDYLAQCLGFGLTYQLVSPQVTSAYTQPYDPARSASVYSNDGAYLGIVGEIRSELARALKLPDTTAGFTLDVKSLHSSHMLRSAIYQQLSKYPMVEQDICLRVGSEILYQDLYAQLTTSLSAHKPVATNYKITLLDIYQRPDHPDFKQFTFRIHLTSYQKTLTDKEMIEVLREVAAAAAENFDAVQV